MPSTWDCSTLVAQRVALSFSGSKVLGEVLSSCGEDPQKRIRPRRLPHYSVFVVYFHRCSHLLPSKVPPLTMEVNDDHGNFNLIAWKLNVGQLPRR